MQLAMLLLGLSVATALWTGVQAINAEARASYDQAADRLGQDGFEQLARRDGELFPQSTFVALRRAGWLVSPVLEGQVSFGAVNVRLIGIDPLTMPRDAQQVDLGDPGRLPAFLTEPGLMFVSAGLAEKLQEQAGLALQISEGLPPDVAIIDIGQAQRLLGKTGLISRLVVSPDQSAGRAALDVVAPGLELQKPQTQNDLARLTDSFHLNLTAFGLLAFVVGLFIVYSAIGLAFEQRRPVFRTLRALGLSAVTLTILLLGELMILAIIAGLAGMALGYLIASALLPDVAATLRGLYGADVSGTLALRPAWWMTGLGIAVLGTLISAAQSLWRVARLPLLAPAQPRAWAMASEGALRVQGLSALALFGLSYAILELGSGLIVGFAVLGGLLLGSALMLPVLLAGLLLLAQRLARGPLAEWFWADTRQQLPGLSLALMALLLALAANIGVGTMVASFRLTFTGYLDQRLAAELYVQARSDDEALRMQDWLGSRVDAVLPMWSVNGSLEGEPAEIFGAVDHSTYRDNWPLLQAEPDAWDRVASGEAVLINEQLSRRKKLVLGDQLTLPGNWSATIAGVYSDYGNPSAQAIVGMEALKARYPDASGSRFGVRLSPGKVQDMAKTLQDEFDLPAQNLIDQASIKRLSLQIFERTFSVTAALNVLTLGVAGVAMFAALMTLSAMRLPQLAPVWAMGLTRRHLALLELGRTLALAAITMIAALPVGIGLAWVLLAVVNVEAFGWRLPMHLFPADWLRLTMLALLSALVAVVIPVRRLATLSPSDLLRVFSNER